MFNNPFTINLCDLNLTQLADLFALTWNVLPNISNNGINLIFDEMIINAGEHDTRKELQTRGISNKTIDFFMHFSNNNK